MYKLRPSETEPQSDDKTLHSCCFQSSQSLIIRQKGGHAEVEKAASSDDLTPQFPTISFIQSAPCQNLVPGTSEVTLDRYIKED